MAGLTILALLFLLHTWEQEQFALKIKTQNELNYKFFQIALESEFQKNHTLAQLLGAEPAINSKLAGRNY